MKPLRVYLDSSDYSVLSDPSRQGEMPGLLNQLRKWIATGSITCHFSGAHLSEMAPLDSEYFKVDAAQRRSDVLVDLCGRNALVSLDLLFASEIQWAMGKRTTPPDVYRPNGDWFPDGVGEISPIEPIELLSSMQEAITEMGLSREARRLGIVFKTGAAKPAESINLVT